MTVKAAKQGQRQGETPESRTVPGDLVLQEGLPIQEVERRIGVAVASAGLRHRVVAFYLRDVHERGLHQLAGHRTVVNYAVSRFGISRREARELFAAGRALDDLPVIDAAFREGRLCWSKVRELVKVAVPQHEAAWLQRAHALRIDELALEVRLARPGEPPRKRDDRKGLPDIRLCLNTPMPPDVYAKWERVCAKLAIECGGAVEPWQCLEALIDLGLAHQPADGPTLAPDQCCVVVHADGDCVETRDGDIPLAPETVEMLACNCGVVDASTADRDKDRQVPKPLRRRVYARDGHRCRCCGGVHALHVHHVIPWSCGGETRKDNLVTVCRRCHALIHAGLITIIGSGESNWRFVDADGRDLGAAEAQLPSPGEQLTVVETAIEPLSEPAALPEEIDCAWWRRHAELIRCNESAGTFELRPGTALEDDPDDSDHRRKVAQCATRPARLADLVGQHRVVESLHLAVEAARLGEPMGHTLLSGPPGLGKTTIARALAAELDAALHMCSGPALRSPMQLLLRLAELHDGDVLFIDEIHAIPHQVAEFVYEAMQDGQLSLSITRAGRSRPVTLRLPAFTLVGATTDEGQLPEPFVARFGNREQLRFYEPAELTELITKVAQCATYRIEPDAAHKLAEVSRQTPREALRLLHRARREARVAGTTTIDVAIASRALQRLQIDSRGLGPVDRDCVELLRSRGRGRPIGVRRVAGMLGVAAATLERFHEPYLLRLGLIAIVPGGRVAA
jgi:Holliday junction DNA helicase RuvB